MATGDYLFTLWPINSIPVESASATHDEIDDGSTVAGYISVLDFEGTGGADSHAEWSEVVPDAYAGGGMDFTPHYATDGTVSGNVELEFKGKVFDVADVVTSFNLEGQTAAASLDAPSTTANAYDIGPAASISHANLDSPAIGDVIRIRVTRDISAGTNADDLQLIAVVVTET